MDEELVITEDNFEEYFFDARRHTPQKGQIMAAYRAVGEFIPSHMKMDVIDLLKKDKAYSATRVMKNFHCATELDAIRIPRMMCQDLLNGMSEDDVCEKPYKMTVEYFFYTKRDYVPEEDPHWRCIGLRPVDEFVNMKDNSGTFAPTKIVVPEDFEMEDEDFGDIERIVTEEVDKALGECEDGE